MAITATDTSIGPNTYGVGNPVFYAGLQTAQEYMNYAFQETTTTYFSFLTDEDVVGGHRSDIFQLSLFTIYTGRIWIDPDVQGITVAARLAALTLGDARVQFVIGSGTANLDVTAPSSEAEVSSTLTAASINQTGWVFYSVNTEILSGSVSGRVLLHVRAQSTRVTAANIPAPVNE